jgi:hypothetical protein
MRDRESIEHEIEVKRDELATGLAELKDVVVDKVNVKKRARRALVRGKEEAVELASRARTTARERPALVVAIIAGAVMLIALGVAVKRRRAG